MNRLLFRAVLLITAALSALLLLIRLVGYDSSAVKGFFLGDSCDTMPCWQGIRPGETTAAQAYDILNAHPWVDHVSEVDAQVGANITRPVLIYWTWSSAYPFRSPQPYTQEGIIIVRGGIVQQIYLTTDILFGDMWLALGAPNGGTVDYIYDARRLRMDNTALFSDDALAATASLYSDCAINFLDYWRTPVYLWLQDRRAFRPDDKAYQVYLTTMRTGFQRLRGAFC